MPSKTDKKEAILKTLGTNILVSKKTRDKIIEQIDTLDNQQIESLFVLLSEAGEKQKSILKSLIAKNPEFLNEIETMEAKEIRRALMEHEKKAKRKEEKDLKKLEEDLENL